jgi:hypothetical protein
LLVMFVFRHLTVISRKEFLTSTGAPLRPRSCLRKSIEGILPSAIKGFFGSAAISTKVSDAIRSTWLLRRERKKVKDAQPFSVREANSKEPTLAESAHLESKTNVLYHTTTTTTRDQIRPCMQLKLFATSTMTHNLQH